MKIVEGIAIGWIFADVMKYAAERNIIGAVFGTVLIFLLMVDFGKRYNGTPRR